MLHDRTVWFKTWSIIGLANRLSEYFALTEHRFLTSLTSQTANNEYTSWTCKPLECSKCFSVDYYALEDAYIQHPEVPDAIACQGECVIDPLCNSFDYHVGNKACNLKKRQLGIGGRNTDYIAGPKFC